MKILLDKEYEYMLEYLEHEQANVVFEPADGVIMICGQRSFIKKYYTLPGVKYIQISSAGYNDLDLSYIRDHDITLMNARGVYSIPIAEYAVGYILAVYKKHRMFAESQKRHVWNMDRSLRSLEQTTALLLGTGDIAQEIAKRLKAFDVKCIGLNSDGRLIAGFDQCDPLAQFAFYLNDVDFVIAALPENEATVHLLNKEHLSMMKAGSVFVNVGRGSLLDYKDIHASIQHLAGFVIDVYETEPMPENDPLWELENVYITGHASSGSQNNSERLAKLFSENIKRVLKGEQPKNKIAM